MIWLIRHGEAAASWGEADDPGLSDLGRKQAAHAAELLVAQPVDKAITSPMARCRETAQAFASRSGLPLAVEPAVTEIPTPAGLTDRRAWLSGFMAGKWSDAPDLLKSWKQTLLQSIEAIPDNTAVFTHFVAINAIASHLMGNDDVTVFRPANCSITTLHRQSGDLAVHSLGSEAATQVL